MYVSWWGNSVVQARIPNEQDMSLNIRSLFVINRGISIKQTWSVTRFVCRVFPFLVNCPKNPPCCLMRPFVFLVISIFLSWKARPECCLCWGVPENWTHVDICNSILKCILVSLWMLEWWAEGDELFYTMSNVPLLHVNYLEMQRLKKFYSHEILCRGQILIYHRLSHSSVL